MQVYVQLLSTGGPVLVIILIVAAVGLFFFFERFITFSGIRNTLRKGDTHNPFVVRIQKKLSSARNMRSEEQTDIVELEVDRLFKNIRIISTAATVSPLLGLLGTTTGMIRIFNTIEQARELRYASELAVGIGEALYTTIGGLIVAIVLTILVSVLREMISSIRHEVLDQITRSPTPQGKAMI